MSAIQITFKSESQGGGSSGSGTAVQSADYASETAAVSAISNGFLAVANPVLPSGATNQAAAYNVDTIASIVTISAVTFGNVSGV